MENKIYNLNENFNNHNHNQYSSIKELEDKTQENTILLKNEIENEIENEELKFTNDKTDNSNNNSNSNRNIESKLPLIYGNNKILMYLNNEPFIVIGPHCKKIKFH
jgi:hypothetical protein